MRSSMPCVPSRPRPPTTLRWSYRAPLHSGGRVDEARAARQPDLVWKRGLDAVPGSEALRPPASQRLISAWGRPPLCREVDRLWPLRWPRSDCIGLIILLANSGWGPRALPSLVASHRHCGWRLAAGYATIGCASCDGASHPTWSMLESFPDWSATGRVGGHRLFP